MRVSGISGEYLSCKFRLLRSCVLASLVFIACSFPVSALDQGHDYDEMRIDLQGRRLKVIQGSRGHFPRKQRTPYGLVPRQERLVPCGQFHEGKLLCVWTPFDSRKRKADPSKNRVGYTFCDLRGRLMDKDFLKASDFVEGVAVVQVQGKFGNSIGFIDSDGQYTMEPRSEIDATGDSFSGGLVQARTGEGLWGYMDIHGNWRISPRFLRAGSFNHGLAEVLLKDPGDKRNPCTLIDSDGKQLPVVFFELEHYAPERFDEPIAVGVKTSGSEKTSWGLLGLDGKWLIPPSYEQIGSSSDGLRSFLDAKSGLWGYMDIFGREVLPARYSKAKPFGDGLAFVVLAESSRAACIDKKGAIQSQGVFSKLKMEQQYLFFTDGLAALKESVDGRNLWGYINKRGEWQIPPQFDFALPFEKGNAVVLKEHKRNSPKSL